MNKGFIFFLVVLLTLLGYIFNVDKDITKHFYTLCDSLKNSYSKTISFFSEGYNLYFNQITTIEELRKQIDKNKNYKLLYETTNAELQTIIKYIDTQKLEFDTIYTKVVSYLNLNNYSRVLLDKEIKEDKIYPILTTTGYAAGIGIHQDGRNIGLLNNNEKCNYAVFVGPSNAPGITSGMNNNGEMIIKHIPIWFNIKNNDEVITSGMDRTFPTGIKVGRVVSVKQLTNTKEVYIKPYVDILTQRDFYMIEKK
jgi:rod shape-determining protein MreC